MGHRAADQAASSDINLPYIGFFAYLLLIILELISGTNSKANFLAVVNLHNPSDLLTDIIMILVVLTTQQLGHIGIDSWKSEIIEGLLSLFIATSRIGLAFDIACESMMTVKFRCQRELEGQIIRNTNPEAIWILIVRIFVKAWMHEKTVRVVKARGSVLFTTVARHYRVNAVVNMFTVLSMSIGLFVSNMTRVNSAGGLVMSLLLLQSGIHDVVLACQVLHDHLSKRMIDN
ncbi:unnamed protein product [Fusarium graminearum]|nr:unnamed protein product [Fusarium graminearum]